jgi:hypothetical protein
MAPSDKTKGHVGQRTKTLATLGWNTYGRFCSTGQGPRNASGKGPGGIRSRIWERIVMWIGRRLSNQSV